MIEAVASGIPEIRVESDGSNLRVFPPERTGEVAAALAAEHEGFYSIEDDQGGFSENFGPLPLGTYEHTVAAILSLPGGGIVSQGDDEP